MRGKLIVLDGTDGVGKATQTKLLVARLKREGVKVKTLDFPQYYKNFFGHFVGAMLTGRYGDFLHIDPYIASVMYALDRWESKPILDAWLKAGYTVVLDRYVSANQLHQGGKIRSLAKRKVFMKWLDTVEYGKFGLPRPDLVVYLKVPIKTVLKLLRNKDRKEKKRYIHRGMDIVESDPTYVAAAQKSAVRLLKENTNWVSIECADKKGAILPREAIHDRIYTAVKKTLR